MRKRIIAISSTILLLAAMVALLGFGIQKQHQRSVSDVKITIRYRGAEPLITSTMIRDRIADIYDTLNGRLVDAVDVESIQYGLEQLSTVKSAGVQIRPDGSVEVRVLQRKPLLRVINSAQVQYYVTEDGRVVLGNRTLSAALPVLTGNISEGFRLRDLDGFRCDTLSDGHFLKQAYVLGKAFENHPFINALAEQVYLNADGGYDIVPMVGPDLIRLGRLDMLEDKFSKITRFYKSTYGHIDWSKYSILDARFANQVVCIKK